jgi:hypothetical protein
VLRRAVGDRAKEMQEFDVAAFVSKLDHMGLKLSTIPLADGKLRVNRWRTLKATEHAQQIQDLWTTQIGNNQERMDLLAAHISNDQRAGNQVEPNIAANRMTPPRSLIRQPAAEIAVPNVQAK